jgi:hypothetical protein
MDLGPDKLATGHGACYELGFRFIDGASSVLTFVRVLPSWSFKLHIILEVELAPNFIYLDNYPKVGRYTSDVSDFRENWHFSSVTYKQTTKLLRHA